MRRVISVILILVALAASVGCTSSKSGPDLTKAAEAAGPLAAVTSTDDRTSADGGTKSWVVARSVNETASLVSAQAGDPADTVTESDARFFLYRSGTIWMSPSSEAGKTLIVVYSNDRAIARHPIIAANTGWISTNRGFASSGGGSSNNGFRGGGSGSGK